ncbi:MAG: hypothetical protein QOE70_4385 [Chthoniobacter sp.]|jgi:hypothetical protein|nr:hypothetical protein [Chthoniobacter sp.]
MLPGITINQGDIDALRHSFREYVTVNRRDQEFLWKDQSRKLATDLYVETAAIAPSKAEISADVKAQGWKIPRKFGDGRLGRGVPAQWVGWALAKRNRLIRKRGRKSKKDHLADDTFLSQRPTLAQMQRFVIDMRNNARLFLASGWLGAIFDLGGSLKASSGAVNHERGGAVVRRSPGEVEVTFWNRTPGIETMNAKTGFVAKAVARRLADMQIYIDRKRAEAAAVLHQRAAA